MLVNIIHHVKQKSVVDEDTRSARIKQEIHPPTSKKASILCTDAHQFYVTRSTISASSTWSAASMNSTSALRKTTVKFTLSSIRRPARAST